jgi:hypothetical protein
MPSASANIKPALRCQYEREFRKAVPIARHHRAARCVLAPQFAAGGAALPKRSRPFPAVVGHGILGDGGKPDAATCSTGGALRVLLIDGEQDRPRL